MHLLTIRSKRSNRLHLRAEFVGPGSKQAAERAAEAILRANPDRFVAQIAFA